jgi:hypothetical protein
VSRRPHPYFGKINRLEQGCAAASGAASGGPPPMSPGEQQGVLWQAFRKAAEPA